MGRRVEERESVTDSGTWAGADLEGWLQPEKVADWEESVELERAIC